MKKTYIAPSVEMVKIKSEVMLDSSPAGFSGALGTTNVAGSAALGKERGTRNDADDFDDLW